MRIGYWKSGHMGFDFTKEEVDNLGGLETPISVALVWPAKKTERETKGPTIIVRTNTDETSPQARAKIKAKSKIIASLPYYIASAKLDLRKQDFGDLPDFSMLPSSSVNWTGSKICHVTLLWTKRKPAAEMKRRPQRRNVRSEGEQKNSNHFPALAGPRLGA